MSFVWKLIRQLPPSIKNLIVQNTTQEFRLWIREPLGGGARSIPDQIVSVADGRRFHIGPDYIYLPLHQGQEFEKDATNVVRQLVSPGETVLDVGANYGWYTTLLAQTVGPKGRVFAFEPVPSTFARLEEHLELNQVTDRVIATRSAVGSEVGEVQLHVFDKLSHSRSSISPLNEGPYQLFHAPVTDLDTFLQGYGVQEVDFLKCDVEGAELMVLKGGAGLLRSDRAPILLMELNEETCAAFDYSTVDLWHFLSDQGYDHFYAIDPGARLRQVTKEEDVRSLDLLLGCKGNRVEARMAHVSAAA